MKSAAHPSSDRPKIPNNQETSPRPRIQICCTCPSQKPIRKVVTGINMAQKTRLTKISPFFWPPQKNHGSQNPWLIHQILGPRTTKKKTLSLRGKPEELRSWEIRSHTFQAMARTGGNVQHSPKSSADSPLWKQHGSVHPPAAQVSSFDGFFTHAVFGKKWPFLKADKKRERLRFQVQKKTQNSEI